MLEFSAEFEIRKRYAQGEKQFPSSRLRKADLKGVNLSHANFRGADLSFANLREANLSYCDLRDACLNEADLKGANLQGANLQGASLIKAFLTKSNLQKANLSSVYLTGAFLTSANLTEACLNGAYLDNSNLIGAILTGAYYDDKTQFPFHFNLIKAGMQKSSALHLPFKQKITVSELITTLNSLTLASNHYLGNTLTSKYLESSRPDFPWLKKITIDNAGKINFSGSLTDNVSTLQLMWFEEWIKSFVKNCSQIVQDFSNIIKEKGLVLEFKKVH